ncbi:MAG TPA: hypothetical protein VF815_26485 [Myxococcaceae bacterium]|jgi:hypothetical protein
MEAPQSPQPSSLRKFVRISLLLGLGVLTSGSGLGNPGCDSGGGDDDDVPRTCVNGCAIDGTYQFQFEDTSTLSSECSALGLMLPKGPLVLTFADSRIEATLDGYRMSGAYSGEPELDFNLTGRKVLSERRIYFLQLTGDVSPSPQTATTPVKLQGSFQLLTLNNEPNGTECTYSRTYTATR